MAGNVKTLTCPQLGTVLSTALLCLAPRSSKSAVELGIAGSISGSFVDCLIVLGGGHVFDHERRRTFSGRFTEDVADSV